MLYIFLTKRNNTINLISISDFKKGDVSVKVVTDELASLKV